ncbi:MAG: DUF1538 domain-containing protein [Clostridia bacterium]|nr:DUF1538 domain-containing protein [Clostridia bacterium]
MNPNLKAKMHESLSSVLPITMIVLILSIVLAPMGTGYMMMFLFGAVMLIIGMGLFQLGAEMSMSPLGEGIGVSLARSKKIALIGAATLLLGTLITIAEPDLRVLSDKVPSVDTWTLILTVAIGVGIFLALAVLRIMFKVDLSYLLIGFYGVMLILAFVIPETFRAVAFDSGGVTTGPITVPFIMALGVGISSIRTDKDASSDSFGLVALSSVGPILAVMLLGIFSGEGASGTTEEILANPTDMREVVLTFAQQIPHYALDVFISIIPIVFVFFLFQLLTKRYHKRQLLRCIFGFIYTYVGLVLFLCGVSVGFAPVGTMLGSEVAVQNKWLLIPLGMLIGYFIVKAEPAIQILNKQVQSITNGTISAASMNACLQVGVSVAVGLAMLRVITGISILWIVIPAYIIALVMSRLVPKIFVGIAFDSGGVASGPMTSTFLLPLCIGACTTLGGNIMTDAFGAVALVALTPLIAIQIMGITFRIKTNALKKRLSNITVPEDSDVIVSLEA